MKIMVLRECGDIDFFESNESEHRDIDDLDFITEIGSYNKYKEILVEMKQLKQLFNNDTKKSVIEPIYLDHYRNFGIYKTSGLNQYLKERVMPNPNDYLVKISKKEVNLYHFVKFKIDMIRFRFFKKHIDKLAFYIINMVLLKIMKF
jgi:hypothetical protein